MTKWKLMPRIVTDNMAAKYYNSRERGATFREAYTAMHDAAPEAPMISYQDIEDLRKLHGIPSDTPNLFYFAQAIEKKVRDEHQT